MRVSMFIIGGIAQLVERLVRNEKVRGSNPLTSTDSGKGGKGQVEMKKLLGAGTAAAGGEEGERAEGQERKSGGLRDRLNSDVIERHDVLPSAGGITRL